MKKQDFLLNFATQYLKKYSSLLLEGDRDAGCTSLFRDLKCVIGPYLPDVVESEEDIKFNTWYNLWMGYKVEKDLNHARQMFDSARSI